MKKLGLFAAAMLLLLSAGAWAQPKPGSDPMDGSPEMFYENQSRYGFDETVERIKVEVEKRTWKVTATHDLQQTMKTFGKEVLPVKVLAVCHPKHSSKILELDNERIVSCMMPCRISVYEKSDGKTYVSRINPGPMAKAFGGTVEQVMTESANEIEEIIGGIIIR
jgi:uncharacterized protein (DUF302 family)